MTSMAGITLYSGPLSMFGAKAEIASREKGLDFELVMVPFDMDRLYDPKHPEVARINPKRQVPVLVHGDLEIFDSTQIFEYLEDLVPEPALWPTDVRERARARLIELKSDEVYFPHVIRLMGLQAVPDDPAAVAARDGAARFYAFAEEQLAGRDWLAGPYTYADIAFYMAQLFGERMGAEVPSACSRQIAWRDRMTARPAVAAVVGPMATFLAGLGRPLPDFLAPLASHRLRATDSLLRSREVRKAAMTRRSSTRFPTAPTNRSVPRTREARAGPSQTWAPECGTVPGPGELGRSRVEVCIWNGPGPWPGKWRPHHPADGWTVARYPAASTRRVDAGVISSAGPSGRGCGRP